MLNLWNRVKAILASDNSIKTVVPCPHCHEKLRVPTDRKYSLSITCPKCKSQSLFDSNRYRRTQRVVVSAVIGLIILLLVLDFWLPFVLISKTKALEQNIGKRHEEAIRKIRAAFDKEIKMLQKEHAEEIQRIQPKKLKAEADKHYAAIWRERSQLTAKYAITPREKSQLEMQVLSKDRTKRVETIIREIAAKAAPKNSTIKIKPLQSTYHLDIDFDMSELASREKGTRTKHRTLESLKEETKNLISKVTNDVYQFTRDIDLSSISVGLRHYVKQTPRYPDGSSTQDIVNLTIYKIQLDRKDLLVLKANPFLNTYSTSKHFKVVEDRFHTLKLEFLR